MYKRQAVVYSVDGSDVDNVMIDGKWVVKDNEILTMDEDAIIKESKAIIDKVLAQAGVVNQSRWPME